MAFFFLETALFCRITDPYWIYNNAIKYNNNNNSWFIPVLHYILNFCTLAQKVKVKL